MPLTIQSETVTIGITTLTKAKIARKRYAAPRQMPSETGEYAFGDRNPYTTSRPVKS